MLKGLHGRNELKAGPDYFEYEEDGDLVREYRQTVFNAPECYTDCVIQDRSKVGAQEHEYRGFYQIGLQHDLQVIQFSTLEECAAYFYNTIAGSIGMACDALGVPRVTAQSLSR